MSRAAVEQVIGKLILEPEFRQQVTANAEQALTGFDLSGEEREAFSRMDWRELDGDLSGLEQRLSKARAFY